MKENLFEKDEGLEYLLLLDGEIFLMEKGYWTKLDVHQVEPTQQIPHGIRYSLTLHDRYNQRIIGFDNAHSVKLKRRKYGARKITWDHIHKTSKILPYEYLSAAQLLEDFWEEVEKVLKKQ